MSDEVSIYATGAYHHSCWFYTIKIVIFRDQLDKVFDKESLDHTERLALFLVLYGCNLYINSIPSGVSNLDMSLTG